MAKKGAPRRAWRRVFLGRCQVGNQAGCLGREARCHCPCQGGFCVLSDVLVIHGGRSRLESLGACIVS